MLVRVLLLHLFLSTCLFGQVQDPRVDAVNYIFFYTGQYGNWAETDFTPAVGNLDSYVSRVNTSIVEKQVGFVDQNGLYATVGGKLVTNPVEIASITSTFQWLGPDYTEYNLLAYAGKFSPTELSQIVFVDEQGLYALVDATLLDTATGLNVSFNAADLNIHNDWAETLYKAKEKAYSFRQGSSHAPRKLLVLADPNCPYCHWLYESMRPFTESGELAVEWSLVPLVGSSSMGKILSIFDGEAPKGSGYSRDPLGAWEYNEHGYTLYTFASDPAQGFSNFGGAINPSLHPSKKAIKHANEDITFSLKYNNGIWQTFGESVPVLFFRLEDGSYDYSYAGWGQNVPAHDFVHSIYKKQH